MPELAEVEVVRLGLVKALLPKSESNGKITQSDKPELKQIETFRKDLRFTIPKSIFNLQKQRLQHIFRHGKYLLFEFETHFLISHLGMTGNWSIYSEPQQIKKHDHLRFKIGGYELIYTDPRRFGFVDMVAKDKFMQNRFLKVLGPDPLTGSLSIGSKLADLGEKKPEQASANQQSEITDYDQQIVKNLKTKKAPIRNALLDQSVLCGVGNIYAAEALFLAGINPLKSAAALPNKRLQELLLHVKNLLQESIAAGGSSIDDFHSAFGTIGHFQDRHQVYAKKGQACGRCGSTIRQKTLAGRSAFWCPSCQRR